VENTIIMTTQEGTLARMPTMGDCVNATEETKATTFKILDLAAVY
jgi:hypothetical protein